MALIPLGLAMMPINKLTILLLLVLAADAAVALLLAEDLRQYRRIPLPAELGSYSHRLRCWTAAVALSNEVAVDVAEIEELDNETMNARCAALINRYCTITVQWRELGTPTPQRVADVLCVRRKFCGYEAVSEPHCSRIADASNGTAKRWELWDI